MRMTREEFNSLCLNKKISYSVQSKKHSDVVPEQPRKATKYRNHKVYVDKSGFASSVKSDIIDLSLTFDSEKEYRRWKDLCFMEKAGKISGLQRQVELLIQDSCERYGEKILAIKYKADFCYVENGQFIVEDVKGYDKATGKYITTKDFNLKWKLLRYKYPDYVFRIF